MKKIVAIILIIYLLTACNINSSNYVVTNNDLDNYSQGLSDVSTYILDNANISDFVNNAKSIDNIIEINKESMKEIMQKANKDLNEGDVYKINNTSSITALVNKTYYLPQDYSPKDLIVPDVSFSFDGENEKKYLRSEAAKALENLFEAAKKENLNLYAVSGFRSYQRQKTIYEWNLSNRGEEWTNKYSAKPGHSEHQTGLSMDVSCRSINFSLDEAFENTPEGQWLKSNASEYGFIIRYPKDKTSITGYAYEPWHIRYVGEELAELLDKQNITLEEYYMFD